MEIIVDDREKAVVPFLQQYATKTMIDYKIQRNEVGDYAIVYHGVILMIIERKTWADLAASFRDGRKENIKKLIDLRAKTNCQIAYLIEGPATPALTQKFGRIPIKALRAHLDHIMIRDAVHIIYSKDLDYTASRLFELAGNYCSCKEVINKITGGAPDNTAELKTKMAANIGINEQILRCLPAIGSVVSAVLAENNVTLYKLYNLQYTANDLAAYKFASGAMLGIVRGKKLAEDTKKLIDSDSKLALKTHVKILSTVPLISKKTAEVILQHVKLADILNGIPAVQLADIKKSEKSRLGDKAANNIITHLIPVI
jgi:ERCC4-type nuclease